MKYVAYIEIDHDTLMDEVRLEQLIADLLDKHYGGRLLSYPMPVKTHVHVECPSKRWTHADNFDEY